MSWKPIVAGVDSSPEGVRAAVVAVALARAAKTECYLVHAVRDPWTEVSFTEIPLDLRERNRVLLDASRTLLLEVLKEKQIPPEVLDRMDVRFGPPSVVLSEVADERDAELVVLGGKHHSAVGRWLAGSTAHHMVRVHDRPLLVVGPLQPGSQAGQFRRILAAVDLSSASRPTLDGAERLARLFRADLRALHVVEPLPIVPELPVGMDEDVLRRSEEELERSVWPQIEYPGAETMVRQGASAETVAIVAKEWKADLVVVGSHGRGWVDRVLIGSVTERLLNALPTSVLVIPVSAPVARKPVTHTRRAARAPATIRRVRS